MALFKTSFFIAPLFFILFSCSEPTNMLQPLNPSQPILAFGDSLTFGYGADTNQSYPAQLSKLINRRVINAGVNGELSGEGLLRLEKLLDRYKPQLLLLCHGANDLLQKADLEKMADNLKKMIKMAQDRDIQVLLIAVPNTSLLLTPLKQYQQVATQMNIVVENDLLADLLAQPELHSDLIHPNHLGYQKIAETIAQLLKKQGAIE
ncbi:MAG: acyl-CoA thioesterase-1 [Psychromonas sp.]|jgi:acyl-CoA thioesterase-1|uniref:GDSL-type esterase/lipase family protein n=1 Tax=Psychromonas sp. TaxID=1884585 RepID=UPI0039E4A274